MICYKQQTDVPILCNQALCRFQKNQKGCILSFARTGLTRKYFRENVVFLAPQNEYEGIHADIALIPRPERPARFYEGHLY